VGAEVSDLPAHRCSDTPIKGKTIHVPDVWETWCVGEGCGWGCTADSPESAVIALALHLDPEHVTYTFTEAEKAQQAADAEYYQAHKDDEDEWGDAE
jgi:hypothetical protein